LRYGLTISCIDVIVESNRTVYGNIGRFIVASHCESVPNLVLSAGTARYNIQVVVGMQLWAFFTTKSLRIPNWSILRTSRGCS
jgi:hypothetical protein